MCRLGWSVQPASWISKQKLIRSLHKGQEVSLIKQGYQTCLGYIGVGSMTLALFCLILLRTCNSNSVSEYAQRSPFIYQRRYMSPIDWGWAPLWRNTWCILHWMPLQTDPPPGNPQLRISCGGLWRSVHIFNLERHVFWGHLPRCSEYLGG